jgi:hypothetical protein
MCLHLFYWRLNILPSYSSPLSFCFTSFESVSCTGLQTTPSLLRVELTIRLLQELNEDSVMHEVNAFFPVIYEGVDLNTSADANLKFRGLRCTMRRHASTAVLASGRHIDTWSASWGLEAPFVFCHLIAFRPERRIVRIRLLKRKN